jgi:plasmid maintenance system killer protein
LQREKDKFEVAQTEKTNQIQSQLDAALKQIRNLVQKGEDMEEELKKSQKSLEGNNIDVRSIFSIEINVNYFYL